MAAVPLSSPVISGAVHSFELSSDGTTGVAHVRLVGGEIGPQTLSETVGEVLWPLPAELTRENFNNRAFVSAEVRVAETFTGDFARPHRARLFLQDADGKRLYMANRGIVDRPVRTEGWLLLEGRPTVDIPVALGYTESGFNSAAVTHVGVNFEAGRRYGVASEGNIEIKNLDVTFGATTNARVLEADPEILAGEQERANRMNVRLMERFHNGELDVQLPLSVGVNLAWPSVVMADGTNMHLYGSILHAENAYYGEFWDLRNPKVERSVREDFAKIRGLFGPKTLVRVMLFTDMRQGFDLDAAGVPVAATEVARQSLKKLLDVAVEEQVVLMPVLFDFLMADGQSNGGPDGVWRSGERADLITDPEKRQKFLLAVENLIRENAGHPGVLVWDLINEPENAVAVVTPEHFADLQLFLKEGVNAIHQAGELATVGFRNLHEVAPYLRGRVAVDLGQVHHYPYLESRPAPFDLASSYEAAFGAVPVIWGETPVRADRVYEDLSQAHQAGYRGVLFWSWRGDENNADGLKIWGYEHQIRYALSQLLGATPNQAQQIPYIFTMDDIPMWFVNDAGRRAEAYAKYTEVLARHQIKPVMFTNPGYFGDARDWAAVEDWYQRGWSIGNHGATHRFLGQVSESHFYADVDRATDLLGQRLAGWSESVPFFRYPNSAWGIDPEASCRALQVDRNLQILPASTDIHDWEVAGEYERARSLPEEKEKVAAKFFERLDRVFEEVRGRRVLQRTPADEPEIFLIHSTSFTADYLDEVLTRLEAKGVKWVEPTADNLRTFLPYKNQCRPRCKIEGTCR